MSVPKEKLLQNQYGQATVEYPAGRDPGPAFLMSWTKPATCLGP